MPHALLLTLRRAPGTRTPRTLRRAILGALGDAVFLTVLLGVLGAALVLPMSDQMTMRFPAPTSGQTADAEHGDRAEGREGRSAQRGRSALG